MKIQLEDIHFSYPSGVHALIGVDLEIQTGERVAILGENGAGKTTLAKHLNGLLRPSSGRVLLEGQETEDLTVAQIAHKVGYVFQNPDEQLFKRTVLEEVEFGPLNLGLRGQELRERIEQALEIVGLEDKTESHPFDLLPSERKMLGIASILSMNTPILVLDEPTLGLDRKGTDQLVTALDWFGQKGGTMIIITHDLDFCVEHFQRFVIMAGGEVLTDEDTPDTFLHDDLMTQAGLEPPQLVRLSKALGWKVPSVTVPAFIQSYEHHRCEELTR
jgi:energy-coupling factor transport system ATP-binding protein